MIYQVELLPCPFCGGDHIETISSRMWNDDPNAVERFWIECVNCGAEPFQPTEDQAEITAAWNTRTPTTPERSDDE